MPCQPIDPENTPVFGEADVQFNGTTLRACDGRIVMADEIDPAPPCFTTSTPAVEACLAVSGETGETIEEFQSERPSSAFSEFYEGIVRGLFTRNELAQERGVPWQGAILERFDPEDDGLNGRTLNQAERLFMLRTPSRIESELRWLLNNNPLVYRAWNEAKRAKLSDTSAAEMALICLARENEDLRRRMGVLPQAPQAPPPHGQRDKVMADLRRDLQNAFPGHGFTFFLEGSDIARVVFDGHALDALLVRLDQDYSVHWDAMRGGAPFCFVHIREPRFAS